MFHFECNLNLGIGTSLYVFFAVEFDGRLMPCVLSDHIYCIEVAVLSSCFRTDYDQTFHNGSKAESYCSCLMCADSEYE